MSLYTSNSEYDFEKHIQLTNEMPPYDMYAGVNSVLQNEMWKWFLGYTKVDTDVTYSENSELTYKKKINGSRSQNYGPKPKNLLTYDGVPFQTKPVYKSFEVNGALAVENDLFLHEIYRYLDTLYPDHYDWRHLLTNNEINDAFTNAAAIVDYKPNNDFFDFVAANLEGVETADEVEIESLKIKMRNLKNNAYRRKLYGSKIGYRMFCGDIFQLCSIYPLGTYVTLKPIEGTKSKDDALDNRIIDTLNQNYNKKFKLIDWENDLTVFEDEKSKKYYFSSMTVPLYNDFIFEVPNNISEEATVDDLDIGMYICRDSFKNLEKITAYSTALKKSPVYSTVISGSNDITLDDPSVLDKFYGYIVHNFMTLDDDLRDKAYFVWRNGDISLKDVESVTIEVMDIAKNETVPYKLQWGPSVKELRNGDAIRLVFKQQDNDNEPTLAEFEIIPATCKTKESLLNVNYIKTDSIIAPEYQTFYKIDLSMDAIMKLSPSLRKIITQSAQTDVVFGNDSLANHGRWLYKILSNIDKTYYDVMSKEVKLLYNPFVDGTIYIEPKYTIDSYHDTLKYEITSNEYGTKEVHFIDEGHRLWETDFPLKKDDLFFKSLNWKDSETYDGYGVVDWTRGKFSVEISDTLPIQVASYIDDSHQYAFVFENKEGKRLLVFGNIANLNRTTIENRLFNYSFDAQINVIPQDLSDSTHFNIAYPEYNEAEAMIEYLEGIKNSDPESFTDEMASELAQLKHNIEIWNNQRGNREYITSEYIDSDDTEFEKYNYGIDDRLIYVYEFNAGTNSWLRRLDFSEYKVKHCDFGLLSVMPYIHASEFVYADENLYKRRDYTENRYINIYPEGLELGEEEKKICIQYFDFEPLRAHRRYCNELPFGATYHENRYLFWSTSDKVNTFSKKPDSSTLEVYGKIDVTSDDLKNVITFEDEISLNKLKAFNIGDIVKGPQITSNVYITEVGYDFIRVNTTFYESGYFKYIVEATNICVPVDIDEFNDYKREQVENGHYTKYNMFNTGIYPSANWPRTAENAYVSGLLDTSQFTIYNDYDSFARVMDIVYSNYIKEDYKVFPAIVKFENDIFVELNIRGLLKSRNKQGITPSLMNVELLDYIEDNLNIISRASDSTSVGSSLVINTDNSGKFSLLEDAVYTDPSIHLKFQTFNWNDSTIPKYAQIGYDGSGYDKLFTSSSNKKWPHVYGVAVWDGLDDFYEQYKKAQQRDTEFKTGKRHVWTSILNTIENFTEVSFKKDVEKPLFEISLGEYDVMLRYAPEGSPFMYTTIQSNFYKQSFKNILIRDLGFVLKDEEFVSDNFIVGNDGDDLRLSDNQKYTLLRHKQLGIFNEIADSVYPEIKPEYQVGDFFLITQSKEISINSASKDRNFTPGTIVNIQSPSLIILDSNEDGSLWWKYCTFAFAGVWGQGMVSLSTTPITSIGNESVPTRDTVHGIRTDQIMFKKDDETIYWTKEEADKIGLVGRDFLDALSYKIAYSTTPNTTSEMSVINSLKYQFSKEDLFSKHYKSAIIDELETKYKTIDDEDSFIFTIYYNGGSINEYEDWDIDEIKNGTLKVGDIICIYIYRDYSKSGTCRVIDCEEKGQLIPKHVEDIKTTLTFYESIEIDLPKWAMSAFVIKSDNVWATKIPITRELTITTADWTLLSTETEAVSPLKFLNENFNKIELPRGSINPGSESVLLTLDPKLVAESANKNSRTINISSYPIKYDEDEDEFYVNIDYEKEKIYSDDVEQKQIVKFNENKFFKNVLKLKGLYKTIDGLDEKNNIVHKGVLMPVSGDAWGTSQISNEDYILGFNEVRLRSNWRNDLEPTVFKSQEELESRLIGFRTPDTLVFTNREDSTISQMESSLFKTKVSMFLPTQEDLFATNEDVITFNNVENLKPKIKNLKLSSTIKSLATDRSYESLAFEPNTTFFRNLGVSEFETNLSTSNELTFSDVETERLAGILNKGDAVEAAAVLNSIKSALQSVPSLNAKTMSPMTLNGFLSDYKASTNYLYATDNLMVVYKVSNQDNNVIFEQLEFESNHASLLLNQNYRLVSATTDYNDDDYLVFTKTDIIGEYKELENPLSIIYKIEGTTLKSWSPSYVEGNVPVGDDGLFVTLGDSLFPDDVSLAEGGINELTALNRMHYAFTDELNPTTTFAIAFDNGTLDVKWDPIDGKDDKSNVKFYYQVDEDEEIKSVLMRTSFNGFIKSIVDDRITKSSKIKCCISYSVTTQLYGQDESSIEEPDNTLSISVPEIENFSTTDSTNWPEIKLNEFDFSSMADFGTLGASIKFDKEKDYGVYVDGNKAAFYGVKDIAVGYEDGRKLYDDTTSQNKYWSKCEIPFSSTDTLQQLIMYPPEKIYEKLVWLITQRVITYLIIVSDYMSPEDGVVPKDDTIGQIIKTAKPIIQWLYGETLPASYNDTTAQAVTTKIESDDRWKFVSSSTTKSISNFFINKEEGYVVINSSKTTTWNGGNAEQSYLGFAADIIDYVIHDGESVLLNNIIDDIMFTKSNILFKTIAGNYFGIKKDATRKADSLNDKSNWFVSEVPEWNKYISSESLSMIDNYRAFNTKISYKDGDNGDLKEFLVLTSSEKRNTFEIETVKQFSNMIIMGGYKKSAKDIYIEMTDSDTYRKAQQKGLDAQLKAELGLVYATLTDGTTSSVQKYKYRLDNEKVVPVILYSKDDGASFEELELSQTIRDFAGLSINSLIESDGKCIATLYNKEPTPNPDNGNVDALSPKYFSIDIATLNVQLLNDGKAKDYDFVEVELCDKDLDFMGSTLVPLTNTNRFNKEIGESKLMPSLTAIQTGNYIEDIDFENKKIILKNNLFDTSMDMKVRMLVSFYTKNHIDNPMMYINLGKVSDYTIRSLSGWKVPFSKKVSSALDADMAYMMNEWNYMTNMSNYSLKMAVTNSTLVENPLYYPSSFRDMAFNFGETPEQSMNEFPAPEEGLVPNTLRKTFYDWSSGNVKAYTNNEGTELLLCNEEGFYIITPEGVPISRNNIVGQFDLSKFKKCPAPIKTKQEFLAESIQTEDDLLVNVAFENMTWSPVDTIFIGTDNASLSVKLDGKYLETFMDEVYYTEDDSKVQSIDDLKDDDILLYNTYRFGSTDEEDIKDFNYDENSRFIKSEFGDRFAWYDLLNGAFLIKGIKNAKFDITIPYKYQGQQKEAFVPLSTDGSVLKMVEDDAPITGIYLNALGYGGTRTQKSWINLPWETDIIAFLEDDAVNNADDRIMLCNNDGTGIIRKHSRFVYSGENTIIQAKDFVDNILSYKIHTEKGVLKQTIARDNIIGKDTVLCFPKQDSIEKHIFIKDDGQYSYDNEVVGFMRITDGFADVDLDYIEDVSFYNEGKLVKELQWNNNSIIANGSLTYLTSEVECVVTYTNKTTVKRSLIAVIDTNSFDDDIDSVDWEDLKDFEEFVKYNSLELDGKPVKTENSKQFIITAGIIHSKDYASDILLYEGPMFNIKHSLKYSETKIVGQFINDINPVLVEDFIGFVYLKQLRFNSFKSLIDNQGDLIRLSSGKGFSGPLKEIGDDSLGRIGGELEIEGKKCLVFDNVINDDYLNDGEGHIIELTICTRTSIDLSQETLNDPLYYVEVPLKYISTFEPDRIFFHPEGYPQSPVSYKGRVFNTENSKYYLSNFYKNSAGRFVVQCNELGEICKYVVSNGKLNLVTIPKGQSYNESELAYIKQPIYNSCKEWYKQDFYVSGSEQNPFWHYIQIGSVYESDSKNFKTTLNYYEKIKTSGVLKYNEITEGKFLNIYDTGYLVFDNDVFNIVNNTLDFKSGVIQLVVLKGDDDFVNKNSFIKYGIYAEKQDYKDDVINVLNVLADYDCNTTENKINLLDRDKSIVQATEFGLFDENHNMIAYATFPPIEYRSDTQHISITSIITNGKHTALD